jgi:hypothetical protein
VQAYASLEPGADERDAASGRAAEEHGRLGRRVVEPDADVASHSVRIGDERDTGRRDDDSGCARGVDGSREHQLEHVRELHGLQRPGDRVRCDEKAFRGGAAAGRNRQEVEPELGVGIAFRDVQRDVQAGDVVGGSDAGVVLVEQLNARHDEEAGDARRDERLAPAPDEPVVVKRPAPAVGVLYQLPRVLEQRPEPVPAKDVHLGSRVAVRRGLRHVDVDDPEETEDGEEQPVLTLEVAGDQVPRNLFCEMRPELVRVERLRQTSRRLRLQGADQLHEVGRRAEQPSERLVVRRAAAVGVERGLSVADRVHDRLERAHRAGRDRVLRRQPAELGDERDECGLVLCCGGERREGTHHRADDRVTKPDCVSQPERTPLRKA